MYSYLQHTSHSAGSRKLHLEGFMIGTAPVNQDSVTPLSDQLLPVGLPSNVREA